MKLKNKELQWIYDNIDELKRVLVAIDYLRENRQSEQQLYSRTHDKLCDLLFSFLWVSMGENVPKTLWSASDYSELYGIVTDSELNITSDE